MNWKTLAAIVGTYFATVGAADLQAQNKVRKIDALKNAVAYTTGDFNDDGIEDLVVAEPSGLTDFSTILYHYDGINKIYFNNKKMLHPLKHINNKTLSLEAEHINDDDELDLTYRFESSIDKKTKEKYLVNKGNMKFDIKNHWEL